MTSVFVTLRRSHFERSWSNFLAPKNTTNEERNKNTEFLEDGGWHDDAKKKKKKKKKKEGGEEMVRLVCLYIQHNIGKTTYCNPFS